MRQYGIHQLKLNLNNKPPQMLRIIRASFGILRDKYFLQVNKKGLTIDQQQLQVIDRLESLKQNLQRTQLQWKKHVSAHQSDSLRSQINSGKNKTQNVKKKTQQHFFSNWFKRNYSTYNTHQVKGLYLYGGSGCGKSFLSDLFYHELGIRQKSRQHFHEFIAGIHAELHELQKNKKGFDPLKTLAQERAKQVRLLYLDEFQVTDVADASILRRLFENLLNNGMILLATSNRVPEDLYKNGHQREFFLPFIDILRERCDVVQLKSPDYRLLSSNDTHHTTYISPNTKENLLRFDRVFKLVSDNAQITPIQLEAIKGRKITVKRAAKNVCYYTFDQLTNDVIGDADFRVICKHFKAIFIKDARPVTDRNSANRLIKLFDEAYFRQVKIYMLSEVELNSLIIPPQAPRTEEDFALIRCHSRLIEFQSDKYRELISYCEQQSSEAH